MSNTAVFAPNSTALITGGASGIGLAIAKLCLSKGMRLLLADRDESALEKAKKELGSDATKVVTVAMDVSNAGDWQKLKDQAVQSFGTIEFLILNAGTGMKGTWEDGEFFRKTMETNLFGVINGIQTFLPLVKQAAASKPTSIVITGSKQGITNPPGNPAYNASKAAVKSLAEHLSYDLRDTSTSVHLLVPGWTFTGLTGAMKDGVLQDKPAGAWTTEQVADHLYKKMEEKKFYVICPDNDVTEDLDKKRMLWSTGDAVYGRPPLSRWREDWKDKAADEISKTQV